MAAHMWRGFATGALLAALASPSLAASDPSTLNLMLSADIRGTAPGVVRDENTDTVMMHVFEGLVGLREDGSVGPMLAQAITTSPDQTRYRFTLRPGLRFSNGTPVTSAAVVRSWHWYLEAKNNWLCLPSFDGTAGSKLLSVTADSANAVTFTIDKPDPMFLSRMAGPECGASAILADASFAPDGSLRQPIATGPYKLDSWRRGQDITLSANPFYRSRGGGTDGYVGGKAALARTLHFYIIRDDASRLAALIKGQLDILTNLSTADIRQLRYVPQVRVLSAPVAGLNAILIQTNDPLLRDIRIRRALALTIDLDAITALTTASTGKANPSVVPTASAYHSPAQSLRYRPNIPEAKRLLAAAGYHGQPITMVVNRRYADQFDQALLVQSMARAAGITIALQVLDWATQLDRYQTGNYQLMSFAYSARAEPYGSYSSMLGDRAVSKRKVWGDPTAIAMLKQYSRSSDPTARQALLDQLHRRMIAQLPLIALFNNSDANAIRPGITGFKSWMMSRARYWNVAKTGGQS